MSLGFSRYLAEFEAQKSAQLSLYLGSALRGAFGHALKRLVCVDRHLDCVCCENRKVCIYIRLFEPFNPNTNRAIPVGLILEPEPLLQKKVHEDDLLRVGITLLGHIRNYLPYVVHLFREMGLRGFGARRIPFRLLRFWALLETGQPHLVFEDGDEEITPVDRTSSLLEGSFPTYPNAFPMPFNRLSLEFLTPCRLKMDGQLVPDLSFQILMRTLFRRLSALEHYYGTDSLNLRYDSWLDLAGQVKTLSSDLRWHDWQRYSNRQRTKMSLGGFIGSVTFEGPIKPFLPFLRAGEVTHLGKNAGFGLGQYKIQDG
jgi:hypothetical protein